MECGIRIEGFAEFQIGDNIECYTVEKVAQKMLMKDHGGMQIARNVDVIDCVSPASLTSNACE